MERKSEQTTIGHSWRFFRAGGFDQVRIDSAEDLLALEKLDQKLWLALACPVDGVYFDKRTLQLIDSDGDGRIRANELIAAIKWVGGLLKEPEELMNSKDSISIQDINDNTDEGRKLSIAVCNALKNLGKKESDFITVADIQGLEKIISEKAFNGDGIITTDASDDKVIKAAILDIMKVAGTVTDCSGKPGVDRSKVEVFYKQAHEYIEWLRAADGNNEITPLGNDTANAAQNLMNVREKVEDYFTRCKIAQFDARLIDQLNISDKDFSLSEFLISDKCESIRNLPLSRIEPDHPLPLFEEVNPAWSSAINTFEEMVVRPLFGKKKSLTEQDWRSLLSKFEPWFDWNSQRPSLEIGVLEPDRILENTKGTIKEEILSLIDKDEAEAVTVSSLVDIEKLIRYRRDILSLVTNFVNFKDFYSKGGPAMFQIGTLYLDQRSCKLCVKVDDPVKHSAMAAMAGTYLVYCECRRKAGSEKMTIVAALTNGDSENLIPGRNGIFYDRDGRDWDATVIKIIENPISIRQSFWLPYKSLVRIIESQIAKRAMAAETQSTSKLTQTTATVVNGEKMELPPPQKKLDIGIVAALGVAAGAIGTFFATLMGYASGIIKLGPLAIVGALAGLFLLISGPSVALAYIKLRKRNLGPILDAAGWAINAKAKINVPFGAILTNSASLPQGAKRDVIDPYAEKKPVWPKVGIAVLITYLVFTVFNHLGFIYDWTGGRIGICKGNSSAFIVNKKEVKVSYP